MKTNFTKLSVAFFMALSITTTMAIDITVIDHIQGKLEAEITAQLTDNTFENITTLTISGGDVNMTDATAIKKCVNIETIDVSGVAFFNNVMDGNDAGGLFAKMETLEHVILPNTIKQIGKGAFRECSNLKLVEIRNENGTTSNLFNKENHQIEIINSFSFFGCSKLVINELPRSVNNMGKQAFQNCFLLNISEIPGFTATKLQESIFRETSITEFTFPASVTSLDKTVFYRDSVKFDGERTFIIRTAAPKLNSGAALNTLFGCIDKTTIKILKQYESSFEAWNAAGKIEFLTQEIKTEITDGGVVEVSGSGLVKEGGVIANGSAFSAYEGENIHFTITPNEGYSVKEILLDNEVINPDEDLTIDSKPQKTLSVIFVSNTTTKIDATKEEYCISTYVTPDNRLIIYGKKDNDTAKLYDTLGQILIETTENEIDLSCLHNDMYILHVDPSSIKVIKR